MVAGSDHVGYRFGLCEVEFSREESPNGKFSRFGHACPAGVERAQNLRDYPAGPVAGDLRHLFARIGGRGAEDGDEYFVDEVPVRIRQVTVMYRRASLSVEPFAGG